METSAIATALSGLSRAFEANPEKARAKYAAATATTLGALKCRVAGQAGEEIETAPFGGRLCH